MTIFIASSYAASQGPRRGADVSPRGDRPRFVQLRGDDTLLFADYRGNFLFNTLGSLLVNPRCGLLFLDFDSGDTLSLTGQGERLWERPREDLAFRGAQWLVQFHVDETVHVVVVFLPDLHAPLWQRTVLYTAMTPAKQRCVIVGTQMTLRHAVETHHAVQRYTGFAAALQRALPTRHRSPVSA